MSDSARGADGRPPSRPATIARQLSQIARILLLSALAGICIWGVAEAQPTWSPRGQPSVFIDISGRVVSRSSINTNCHPWEGGGSFTEKFACRYAGGRPYDVIKGHNPQGFANESFHLNKLALVKLGFENPSEELQWDWAVSHARSCQAYGLTFEDGCGGPGGGGGGEDGVGLPKRLVEYCREWGWRAPGHPGPSNAACKAYRGCDRADCPCFDERRAATASGGTWVFFDPTEPDCRPDRSFDGVGGSGDGSDGDDDSGGDGAGDAGGDGGDDTGDDGGGDGEGPRNACDDALEALEAALRQAQRVCPVGG